jgi:hypothetical protein
MEQLARSLGKPNGKRIFRSSVKIILKHILKTGLEDSKWFQLAQDTNQRRIVFNTLKNVPVAYTAGNPMAS